MEGEVEQEESKDNVQHLSQTRSHRAPYRTEDTKTSNGYRKPKHTITLV